MHPNKRAHYLALLCGLLLFPLHASAEPFLRENFTSLERWEEHFFPKIERHSKYEIVKGEKEASYLQCSSKSSASGIVLKEEIDIHSHPLIRWRWKSEKIYEKGNGKTKAGDDYSIRVYILFRYDPEKASFWTKTKYEAAKLRFGEYPPLATLNYVWSNHEHKEAFFESPYTSSAVIFPLDSGTQHLGTWREHSVNVLEDYRRAFGEDAPKTAQIAIMNDSDNTEESSISLIDFVEVTSE